VAADWEAGRDLGEPESAFSGTQRPYVRAPRPDKVVGQSGLDLLEVTVGSAGLGVLLAGLPSWLDAALWRDSSGCVLGLISSEELQLTVLPGEQKEHHRCAYQNRDDPDGVRPVGAGKERRFGRGDDLC
jgi:hypothetical protein